MKQRKIARWAGGLVGLLLAILSACSSDSNNDHKPVPTGTPAPVAWLRPQGPIGHDTFSRVRMTGLMRAHQQTVNGVAFSPSVTRLASVGVDNTAIIWNLANGESLVAGEENDGRRVYFGPDDQTVITISGSGLARVFAINLKPPSTLEQLTQFPGYDLEIGAVDQSPDRTLIAFGAQNGGLRIWKIPAGDVVVDVLAHSRAVQFVAFSPDGKRLVSISVDQGVRVWSIPDGELVYDLTDYALTPLIAAFSPDFQQLAVANKTGIQVWNMESGQKEFFIAAADYAASSALRFSPDGSLLAGCGAQPVIGVWNTADGAFLGGLPIPGQVCANIAFSPDSTLLLTLPSPGRDVFLWDITHIADDVPPEEKLLTRGNRQTLGLSPGAQFHDIAWSPDGRFIVLVDDLGPLYVLSAAE